MASTSTHFTYNRELLSHVRPLLKRKEARNRYVYISPAYAALTTIKTYTKNFTIGSSNFPSLLYFSLYSPRSFHFWSSRNTTDHNRLCPKNWKTADFFQRWKANTDNSFCTHFSENTAWNLLLFLAKPLHILWQHLQSTTEEEWIEMQGKIGACKEHWMVLRSLMQMFFSRAEVCFHEKRNRRGMGK